ncbi:hypothetical protein TSAR_002698 [Trichomalopsis sarcophagae]|uniref:Uncharacterized protein n=1 Tax=Trichomalopsis sarcophagae TaxID=543379 RepID=A0A232EDL2_9HYME|nr:hypothetical protein TSAR_002698 [Trichomalopsis sarcophagae]
MEQIRKVQQENMKQYNKKRIPPRKYKYGDIVSIRRSQLNPGLKLRVKFLGPYIVTKVNKHDRYEIEALTVFDGPANTSTEAQNMKPWRGFKDDLEEYDDENDSSEEDKEKNQDEEVETNSDIEDEGSQEDEVETNSQAEEDEANSDIEDADSEAE